MAEPAVELANRRNATGLHVVDPCLDRQQLLFPRPQRGERVAKQLVVRRVGARGEQSLDFVLDVGSQVDGHGQASKNTARAADGAGVGVLTVILPCTSKLRQARRGGGTPSSFVLGVAFSASRHDPRPSQTHGVPPDRSARRWRNY
jgi:hypothetical protein